MDAVVAIHNNMNEMTWRRVLEWSPARRVRREAQAPPLRRPTRGAVAQGGGAVLPGAQVAALDRHDWTVDRCGQEVQYIIDYYDIAARRADDRLPTLHDTDAVPSIECDVRPAGDTLGALADRARMMLPGSRFPEPKAPTTANDDAGAAPASPTYRHPPRRRRRRPLAAPLRRVAAAAAIAARRRLPWRTWCATRVRRRWRRCGRATAASARRRTSTSPLHRAARVRRGGEGRRALKGGDDHHAQAERYEWRPAWGGGARSRRRRRGRLPVNARP